MCSRWRQLPHYDQLVPDTAGRRQFAKIKFALSMQPPTVRQRLHHGRYSFTAKNGTGQNFDREPGHPRGGGGITSGDIRDCTNCLHTDNPTDQGHTHLHLASCPDLQNDDADAIDSLDPEAEETIVDEGVWMQFASEEVKKQLGEEGSAPDQLSFPIEPEEDEAGDGLVEEMDQLRDSIDREYGWSGKDIRKNKVQILKRAATQLCVLLVSERASKSDAKSEYLITRENHFPFVSQLPVS
jgi:hypothetical protein